jgi:type II secretory pathway pseudopilin PulG
MPTGEPIPCNINSGVQQQGFTLLAVLAAMVLVALGTQKVMSVVSQQAQRDRETELLHVGSAFASAIGAYYESTPGSVKKWPASLQDLTDDQRFVGVRRHLRQVYDDPVSRSNKWGLVVAEDGGFKGIYSLSEQAPIKTAAIELAGLALPPARKYSDWQFVYQADSAAPAKPKGPP